MKKRFTWATTFSVFFLLCALCAAPVGADQTAVVATAASDYTSGAHSVISVNPVGGPRTVQNDLLPTGSDVSMVAYGKYGYRIERYQADNVTKFDVAAPDTVIWQFSTLDAGETVSSNPYDLVFASETKAYLLRWGRSTAWIVNPSATTQANFKVGELDLSAYADYDDGVPGMTAGLILDGKLFIIMQNIDQSGDYTPGAAYVAVYDISTDTQIDTGKTEGLKGIALPMKNPSDIQYLPETGMIWISCQGRYEGWTGTPAAYSGGILKMDPDTYDMETVIDDGDDDSHPYGNISNMALVSATKGYFIGYAAAGDNTLFSFNPSTGVVDGPVMADLQRKNLGDLAVDKNGMLWVGNGTDAAVSIVNPQTDALDETVDTNLNPIKIAFAEDGGYVYYLPCLVNDGDYATALALKNLSAKETASIHVVGYSKSGDTIYSQSLSLDASAQTSFLLGKQLDLEGWVKISSSQPLGGLSFVAGLGAVPYMANMSVVDSLEKSLAIPHVAQVAGYWDTVVYICNPNDSINKVTLTFYDKAGQSVATKVCGVPAMGSIEVAMTDLLGDTDYDGGSVTISGTQGVAAFALYHNLQAGGYNFAGLSAVVMP